MAPVPSTPMMNSSPAAGFQDGLGLGSRVGVTSPETVTDCAWSAAPVSSARRPRRSFDLMKKELGSGRGCCSYGWDFSASPEPSPREVGGDVAAAGIDAA